MRAVIEPKFVSEIRNQTFDFTSQLATSETISTKTVVCTVYSGTDASPSSVVFGAASSSGAVVTQIITGGVSGVIYELACTITTSGGQTLKQAGYLAVIPDLP